MDLIISALFLEYSVGVFTEEHDITVFYTWGGVLPYKRLMGMCRLMGSHFHDWIDYNGVAFSIELLEWGRTFSDFWGKTVLHIYG